MNAIALKSVKRRFILSTLGVALSQLVGVAPALAQGQVLTIGNPLAPISLDPATSGNGRAGTALMPAYEPLVRMGADGKLLPALALSWEQSADGKDVTFTLRKDAKFSDGEPVNAEAVKKSIEYYRNAKGPFQINLANITAIDILEPYKVRIKNSQPQPALTALFEAYWLGGDIISPKALANPAQLGTQTFGAGPYMLDAAATITRKSYSYVPNPHYYDKSKQKWDKVIITIFEDQNSAIQSLKAGQTKVLVSDPITANANAANLPKELRIVSEPVGWSGVIIMDRDGVVNPVLKDIRVRRAMNHAVDRPLISKVLFGKFAEPSVQLQGKGFMGYDPANESKYTYDVSKAKALLAEAGYDKNPREIRMGYVNNSMSVTLSQVVMQQFKRVGLNIKPVEYQNFGAMLQAEAKKEVELLVFNTNFGIPNLAKNQTLEKGSLNMLKTSDAKLSSLMAEAANLPLSQADAAWKKVYAHVVDLAWFAPIGHTHVAYFAHESVKMPRVGSSIVIDVTNMEPAK
jgi:peptide/nickel transport system substrate-binding protein